MRVDIAQSRNRTVGAAHVGAVDDDLVTGEELERVACFLVRAGQPAEGHIIT